MEISGLLRVAHIQHFYLQQIQRINISELSCPGIKIDNQEGLYISVVCNCSISSCSREKTTESHSAERVIARQLLFNEQASNAGAKRRAGRIASDTIHPGNQMLEDLWEVELVHPHGLCLPLLQPLSTTCPPTQLALHPEPQYISQLSASM